MSKILIYGDSNVWGDNFLTGRRIPADKQWVNILKKELPSSYELLQEGLPGRVAGSLETLKKYKNGQDTFLATFKTCAPVDIVIIALGTNDLQIKYNRISEDILKDLLWYKNKITELYNDPEDKIKYFVNEHMPKIIFVAPIPFDIEKSSEIFNKKSQQEREKLLQIGYDVLDNWLDVGSLPLFEDGIHLNYEGHIQMAEMIKKVI